MCYEVRMCEFYALVCVSLSSMRYMLHMCDLYAVLYSTSIAYRKDLLSHLLTFFTNKRYSNYPACGGNVLIPEIPECRSASVTLFKLLFLTRPGKGSRTESNSRQNEQNSSPKNS